MIRFQFLLVTTLGCASGVAFCGPLEDAYRKGYEAGYHDATQPGTGTVLSGTGSLVVPGSEFSTTIVPKSGTNFQVAPDSSIAIVPNRALQDFQRKLGPDFLRDNKIQLNDGLPAQ